jgi:hypothetical protein
MAVLVGQRVAQRLRKIGASSVSLSRRRTLQRKKRLGLSKKTLILC